VGYNALSDNMGSLSYV